MANCRGNCQAEMLLGKCTQSDLEPVKLEATREHCMFYGLRNSRIWADNADLLRQLGRTAKGAKNIDRRSFKPLKYK
ncbi:hypothetical protein BBM67_03820 [Vibrio parahaemolyticus]|nr:hypothetical protein BBM67_03820 [Vibrio parahaemolyticus]